MAINGKDLRFASASNGSQFAPTLSLSSRPERSDLRFASVCDSSQFATTLLSSRREEGSTRLAFEPWAPPHLGCTLRNLG
jgi:hypothetical protein